MTYDANILRAVNVTPTLMLNGAYCLANPSLNGEVRFAFATTKPSTGGGTLFNVEFEVLPYTEGKVSPLILEEVELAGSQDIHKQNGKLNSYANTGTLPKQKRSDTSSPKKAVS